MTNNESDKRPIVYLAGKITGDPKYRSRFKVAEQALTLAGYVALNPATMPQGMDYDAYMRIGAAMLAEADAICMLPNWKDSKGAKIEHDMALKQGKKRFLFQEPGSYLEPLP